jgi:enoyl-CoA hydratase/carnithine racemase
MPLRNAATQDLLREDIGRIALLTLNRPEARNALSGALVDALKRELDQIRDDASVHVVVLRATGPVFSAGHDLKEVLANRCPDFYADLFERCTGTMTAIKTLPQPVIAAVQGVATAAGCQLVAMCDLAVASEQARFGTPGVNIGLWCSTPMVALSRAVNRKAAMEMLLTGDLFDAEDALRFGLVNKVVPHDELMAETMALAAKIAAKSRLVVGLGKEAFYRQDEMDMADAYRYAADVMAHNILKDDAAEGIGAFVQKRQPAWTNR